jgi:uncharacterized protein with FMN-binding domain
MKKRKIIITCIVLIVAIALIISICIAMRYKNYQDKVHEMSFSEVNVSSLADGIYIGECDVDVIYARVEVTIQKGAIADIKILEHRNERGGNAEAIIDRIIEEQRLDVDAVSSATNSSKVIRKAVENALLQIK